MRRDVLPVHRAQLLSYLKLSGRKLGLLINFNVAASAHGIHRAINGPRIELDEIAPLCPSCPLW